MGKYLPVNVKLTSGLKLSHDFDNYWKCLTFNSCDWWTPTNEVFWSKVPKNGFVAFFETDTCWHGGKWYYISHATHKWVPFEKTKKIRSIMIGKGSDYFRRPHVIYHDCKLLPDHMESTTVNGSDFGEIDSSSSSDEWVDGHITAIAGGLSPNWTAALLD